jgi:hypothetical protein
LEGDVATALLDSGIDVATAERLIAFVPMAFGRVLLSAAGVTGFEDGFEIRDPDSGRSRRGRLSAESLFVAATEYARTRGGGALTEEQVRRVAETSAEVRAAMQLARGGSLPRDVRFTEAVFLRMPIDDD